MVLIILHGFYLSFVEAGILVLWLKNFSTRKIRQKLKLIYESSNFLKFYFLNYS